MAKLDHYDVLRKLTENKAQVNDERARSTEGHAKVAKDWDKVIKD